MWLLPYQQLYNPLLILVKCDTNKHFITKKVLLPHQVNPHNSPPLQEVQRECWVSLISWMHNFVPYKIYRCQGAIHKHTLLNNRNRIQTSTHPVTSFLVTPMCCKLMIYIYFFFFTVLQYITLFSPQLLLSFHSVFIFSPFLTSRVWGQLKMSTLISLHLSYVL